MIFTSKKAMSPLIATVLLIAFAVALGAMIMNWSAGVEPMTDSESIGCEGVSITSGNGACYADNSLSFNLKNNGKARVEGVKLIIIDAFGETATTLKDSALISGETITGARPYLYDGSAVKLEFVPLIADGQGDFQSCRIGGFTQEVLPNC